MYKIVNGKERIFYLDELRALAIIFVLLAHVCRKFSEYSIIGSWQWFCSSPLVDFAIMGVPLFLMISGSLLLNKEMSLGDFLKRRFSRILIPFIPWALILPFLLLFISNNHISFSSYINILLDNEYWFVWMLIGVYLFIPIVNSFIKEYSWKGCEYYLVIWFFYLILNTLGLFPFHQLELSYFAGYFGYLMLGYYLGVSSNYFLNGDGFIFLTACYLLFINSF